MSDMRYNGVDTRDNKIPEYDLRNLGYCFKDDKMISTQNILNILIDKSRKGDESEMRLKITERDNRRDIEEIESIMKFKNIMDEFYG